MAPLVTTSGGVRQINPVLAQNHLQVIKDTHGKTSLRLEGRRMFLSHWQVLNRSPVASAEDPEHATSQGWLALSARTDNVP